MSNRGEVIKVTEVQGGDDIVEVALGDGKSVLLSAQRGGWEVGDVTPEPFISTIEEVHAFMLHNKIPAMAADGGPRVYCLEVIQAQNTDVATAGG